MPTSYDSLALSGATTKDGSPVITLQFSTPVVAGAISDAAGRSPDKSKLNIPTFLYYGGSVVYEKGSDGSIRIRNA